MFGNIIEMDMAWILPLIVVFGFIFLKIILPNLGSSSKKEASKEEVEKKEPNWKKSAIVDFIVQGAFIAIFVLLTLFLTDDPHEYMGFPTSVHGAVVNFAIGGLIGIAILVPYYNIPRIWKLEKEKVKKIFDSVPGPKEAQKYWVPISILLGVYWEEIIFRGALIAVPAALLTFPYDLWVIFVLVSSFFASIHIISKGPQRWDRKIDLIKGVSISFGLGLIFIWRWSIIAAGSLHLMFNIIPWITYRLRE